MTPKNLQSLIYDTVKTLGIISFDDVTIERPRDRKNGDWSTNIALKFAKAFGFSNPRECADDLALKFRDLNVNGINVFKDVLIAGPGFINFVMNKAYANSLLLRVIKERNQFGSNQSLANTTINLEFVSANPTGPLHIGGVRWAAVGDSLANVFEFNGAKVVREYYFNDHGSQIDNFANSLYADANNLPIPQNGYAGKYISQIVETIHKDALEHNISISKLDKSDQIEFYRKTGVEIMFPMIKQSLEEFRVHFDVFFHEQSLYDNGRVKEAIDILDKKGVIYQKDNALWVKTSQFGDDKDRVIIKSDGSEAYFAADIAYYLDKRHRKNNPADSAIYMLGADHSGYVSRLYAVAQAFGDEVHKNIEVFIGQLVNLIKDGEVVKMSKRAGNIITIDDLVDAVGVDAARYALTRSSADTTLEIDLDLLASHSNENPVYYVQYAHARTFNVTKMAKKALGDFDIDLVISDKGNSLLELLDDDDEEALVALLAKFETTVAMSAKLREPHRIARYLEELASAYHKWYAHCRIMPNGGIYNDDFTVELTYARLILNVSTNIVLKNGLNLLGVSALDKM